MKTPHKEKTGITSIVLAAYLLILMGVFSVVLFNIVTLVGGSARQQLNSLQNFYYLERGAFYAQYNIMKTQIERINGSWPTSEPGTVNISTPLPSGNPPAYLISVSRQGRTLRMTYANGARTSFGITQ